MPVNIDDGTKIGPLQNTTTSFIDTNVTLNSKYYYK
jgi:hypothetical protein